MFSAHTGRYTTATNTSGHQVVTGDSNKYQSVSWETTMLRYQFCLKLLQVFSSERGRPSSRAWVGSERYRSAYFDCVLMHVCALSRTAAVSDVTFYELANLTAKDLGVSVLLVLSPKGTPSLPAVSVPKHLRLTRLPPGRPISILLFTLTLARREEICPLPAVAAHPSTAFISCRPASD